MSDYLLEVCSGRAAWQIQPTDSMEIDMEEISLKIIASGWECTLRNRLCYSFSGEIDFTLFPSGKLLVKTGDQQIAENIAKMHIDSWLS
ncbi:MAG: hypothetical protein HOE69_00470 [Euryarchaeota archaeon]|jgi:hypothetical protein|nr:hypothetical protein [Euryarchaeota archaeon]